MDSSNDALKTLLSFCREDSRLKDAAPIAFFESSKARWTHGVPRLLFVLEGVYGLSGQQGDTIQERFCAAPALLYCSRNGWMQGIDGQQEPFVALSFSYFPSFLRSMVIDYDGVHEPPTPRDVFFTSRTAVGEEVFHLIDAIDSLHQAGQDDVAMELLPLLYRLTVRFLHSLNETTSRHNGYSYKRWMWIQELLRVHCREGISREGIARQLHISPSYVSRLCRQFAQMNFQQLRRSFQLEEAETLLKQSSLNLKEIAVQCGFADSNYLIRCFRQKHGQTPSAYRKSLRKNEIS